MPANLHGTAVILGDRGVLITGPSGAGKTALALELIGRVRAEGRLAALVCDDQAMVAGESGRAVAASPASIAGLAEIRGFGVAHLPHEGAAVVDLLVELVEPARAERMPAEATGAVAGIAVPCLRLPADNEAGAARAVLAALGMAPFLPAADAGGA